MLEAKNLPNSEPGEQTVLFLRRHWTGILKLSIITIVAAFGPILVGIMVSSTIPSLLEAQASDAVISVFLSMYYLTVITFFFQEFIDYYLDTWIVTTERIVDIEQRGLFKRTASEMHMTLVQDSSAEIEGFLHTFLDYGDVHVQTAGEEQRFHFKDVPHPERVRNTILRLAEQDRRREEHSSPKSIMSDDKQQE